MLAPVFATRSHGQRRRENKPVEASCDEEREKDSVGRCKVAARADNNREGHREMKSDCEGTHNGRGPDVKAAGDSSRPDGRIGAVERAAGRR